MSSIPSDPNRPPASAYSPRRPRRWIPYAGGLALLLLITMGLWPKPTPVETARAGYGPLRATVNEEGKTRIKQRFTISAPVAGQLRRIELKPGAEVRAGYTVVATVDPVAPALLDARSRTQSEAKRDTARANLEKAKAAHRFALSELKRFEKLFKEQAISPQELEPVQWREASTAREETAAESSLRQAEAELAEFTPSAGDPAADCPTPVEIKSPITGRVLRVPEESARVVTAGTPLMEVGDPTDLEAVIEVLSRDGAAIKPGTKVELEQWGGPEPLQGRVRLVEPAAFTKVSALGVEEQRVNVIADILTPPGQRRSLGDGFRVEARIIVWEDAHALKVPAGALFRRGQDWATFALEGGHAHLRTVTMGRSSGTETQILSGLKEGEEVVIYPGDRVRDGDRVRPVTVSNS
jgi:HlyD family secretion protein